MRRNIRVRVRRFLRTATALFTTLYFAWSCGGDDSTGPAQPATLPDNVEFAATFYFSHHRITTPGNVRFRVAPNKPITRIEVYNGTTKVAEDLAPAPPYIIGAPVTAADNGTHNYLVKAYDAKGASVESVPTIPIVVDIKWTLVQNVGGVAEFIAMDATNAVYLAGTSGAYDLFLGKYDADGRQLWTRAFGGPDFEYARSFSVTASGRVYLTGMHYVSGQFDDHRCFVNFYDPSGGLLASRLITTATMDRTSGCKSAVDASGNMYVIGHTTGNITTGYPFALKYDPDGNVLWSREISGAIVLGSQYQINDLTSIVVDALGGGVYVTGHGNPFDGVPSQGQQGLFLLKLDANGNRIWGGHYLTAGVETFPQFLVADPNGGVYVAGKTEHPDNQFVQIDAFVASYGPDGKQRWMKTLDGGSLDIGTGAAADTRGVYLVGSTYGEVGRDHVISEPSQGWSDLFVARYSAVGDLLGIRLLGTPNYDGGSGIVIGATGDVYVAGGTAPPMTIGTAFLARYRDAP